jgi:hypothetical protein
MTLVGLPIVALVNVFDVTPSLAFLALLAYMAGGALIIGNYALDHKDQIPPRAQRPPRPPVP